MPPLPKDEPEPADDRAVRNYQKGLKDAACVACEGKGLSSRNGVCRICQETGRGRTLKIKPSK